MIRGLNAGFGNPIAHELAELARRKVAGIRQALLPESVDISASRRGVGFPRDPARTGVLVSEFARQPFWVQWIANRETLHDAPIGSDCTVLNEPNLHGWTPTTYAAYLDECRPIAEARELRIWAPSVANLSRSDLAWVLSVVLRCPWVHGIDVHWYPNERDQDPTIPKKGNTSIEEQFRRLVTVCDGRPWTCSEFGIHQAPMTTGPFWNRRHVRLTEQQQADRIRWMFETLERFGCHAACLYQIQDDPHFPDHPEGTRGIRHVNGLWKLAADPEKGVFA